MQGCDKHLDIASFSMAMVRPATTSFWHLNTDTKYSTTEGAKRIESIIKDIIIERL